jgi:hypothetical protein
MASRVYRPCFSAFCYRVERPIPAHRRVSGNVFFHSPQETCRAYPSAFWLRNVGTITSDRCYADDRPSSFCLRRDGAGVRSGLPTIVIAGSCAMGESPGERQGCDMNGGHLGRKHRLELIIRFDALYHGEHEIKPALVDLITLRTRISQLSDKTQSKIVIARPERLH